MVGFAMFNIRGKHGVKLRKAGLVQRGNAARSAVSNGGRLFLDVADGRTKLARRFRDLFAEMTADMGGPDRLSAARLQLVRRSALLSVRCELAEADAAAGRAFDAEGFRSDTKVLRMCLLALGLDRLTRDVTPTLSELIGSGQAAGQADEQDDAA